MIEKRPFGRTGHQSSVTLFGAAALKAATQAEADRTLDVLLEFGVNHIDTAPRYGDAELRIGPWMAAHRKDFFLATKNAQRDYKNARDELSRSLERLRVDSVDLIQMHALYHPDEWDRAMGEGGALQALVDARDEGLVRFIGVTGHSWTVAAMHRRSLARFDFDSVLMPCNYYMMSNERYRNDFDALVRECETRNVAVQTIKSIARGPWATSKQKYATWYEPLEDQADIDLAMHWVMGRPGIFVNTVGDMTLLPKVLDAAQRFETRPSDAQMADLVERRQISSLFGIGDPTPLAA